MRDVRSARELDDWYRSEWPRLVSTFSLAAGDRELGREIAAEASARVLDRRTDTVTAVPGWSTNYAFSRVAWTPDCDWVLFETTDHHIGAYRPADGQHRDFPGACCGVALITLQH
jgi:hypothetical protein